MIYVLAGSIQQFRSYCNQNGLNPFPGSRDALFVGENNPDMLRGIRGATLVVTGTPNPAFEQEATHYVRCFGGTVTYA